MQPTLAALRLLYKQGMLRNMQTGDESANVRVGKAVAKFRRGMSQAELAQKLAAKLGKKSIDPTTITRIENGKRAITVDELEAFAEIFGVLEEDLLAPTALSARLDKVNDDYRDLLRAQRAFSIAQGRLQNLAEDLRCAVFDKELRDEDVVKELGEDGVTQLQEELETARRMLNGEWGIPWPIAATETDANGSILSYRVVDLDGTTDA